MNTKLRFEADENLEVAKNEEVLHGFPQFIRDSHEEELVGIVTKDAKFATSAQAVNSFYGQVSDHLNNLSWTQIICEQCSKIYFAKSNRANVCPQCRPAQEFLTYGKRNKPVDHNQLAKQTDDYFSANNYKKQSSFPMIPSQGNTLFTVAGVQVLNPHIFGSVPFDQPQSYILQPSIRLQTMDNTRNYPGCSTAFVNAVTINASSDLRNHLQHFDNWLDYFSEIGIHIKDLRAKLRFDLQNWGLGSCLNYNIDLYYGGLSLFNASYFHEMPTRSGKAITISDMGITIERTLWMLNKTPSYFDNIGPYELSLRERDNEADAIRTMVLMIGSGVSTDAKDGKDRMRSKKVRSFSKKTVHVKYQINIEKTVEYFYRYWSNYVSLAVSLDEVKAIIQSEYQRSVNIEILEKLGTRKLHHNVDRPTDEFIRMILDERIATRREIAAILI